MSARAGTAIAVGLSEAAAVCDAIAVGVGRNRGLEVVAAGAAGGTHEIRNTAHNAGAHMWRRDLRVIT